MAAADAGHALWRILSFRHPAAICDRPVDRQRLLCTSQPAGRMKKGLCGKRDRVSVRTNGEATFTPVDPLYLEQDPTFHVP